MSSMYIWWWIFLQFMEFLAACAFPKYTIEWHHCYSNGDSTNSNGDTASPWKIALWIFPSTNLFPHAVGFTRQFSMEYSINFMTSPDILYILRQSIIQLCRTLSCFFAVNSWHSYIFPSRFTFLDQCIADLRQHPFNFSIRAVSIFHIIG